MAYNRNGFSVLAYANGFTLWHYTTDDGASDIETPGYFNTAAEMMRQGDMILANVDIGGTPEGGIYLVSRSSGGVVDVANMYSCRMKIAQ